MCENIKQKISKFKHSPKSKSKQNNMATSSASYQSKNESIQVISVQVA